MKMTNQNQSQEISDGKIFIASDDPDFLEVVLTEVQLTAAAGHPLTKEDLRRIELTIRFVWGGQPVYCRQSKTAGRDRTIKLVRQDVARGVSRRSIAQTYNISLRQISRYLEGTK